ncbi:MAG: ABC transporter ATP-binding protein/permease [Flavobacteriales bacterium]|nr:ABC transporter ATP-binding protein/permease [Flavobacteriales bacterium]
MRALAHLNKYLWRYKWQLILGMLFIVASNLFGIYAPRLIREAFDLITQTLEVYSKEIDAPYSLALPPSVAITQEILGLDPSDFQDLSSKKGIAAAITLLSVFLAGFYLFVSLLKGVFLFFTRQTIIVMSRLIEFDLKNEVYDHYQKLSLGFYRRNNTGDLMNRISEDVSQVRMYLGPAIMYSINLVVLAILAIGAMLSVNVELTLYVLMPLPLLSVSIYYVSRIMNERSEKVQRQQSKLSTLTQEAFSGIRVLKAYNRQEFIQNNFARECNTYKSLSLRQVKVDALFMPAIILLIGLSTIITIYVGGIKAIQGEITIGNIAEFVIYVNMLTWPFASVGWVTSLVQRAAASQERINEFLHTAPEIVNKNSEPSKIAGNIIFENVSFSYTDSGIEALKNINLSVPKGSTLAIIGRTGSGKSTIANLICRLYDASSGHITIDQQPIEEINLNDLRCAIGYVPQDVFLFSDTIANNIAFGLDSEVATSKLIRDASQKAYVEHNIEDFPDKFETLLGERGINLSGGQKQRVSIARAIARKPQILIFDDCLSAVDTETEEKILNNLQMVMNGKTTILISHRISTVKTADQIIVLDSGIILEQGTHHQLVAKKGEYYALYQKQLLEEKEPIDH